MDNHRPYSPENPNYPLSNPLHFLTTCKTIGNNIITIPPPKLINRKETDNNPFSAAITYAHVQMGINRKTEVISPGENFLLTIVVPIWANNPFTAAKPINMYEKRG
jgi:hypothetical protein